MTDLNKASQEFWLTQAQYDTRKNAGTLVVGAIYHITDVSYESTSNKVTSLTSSSTNTQYPSAKCVYDEVSSLKQDKVDKSAIVTEFGDEPSDDNVPSEKLVLDTFSEFGEEFGGEITDLIQSITYLGLNKIETSAIQTSVSSESTDAQVPSAKCVYDSVSQLSQDKVDKASQATKTSAMTSEVGIDANGKLWSVGGGGGGDYHIVYHTVLTEDVHYVLINQQDNGNPLALTDDFIIAYEINGASTNTSEGYLKIAFSDNNLGNRIIDMPSGIRKPNSIVKGIFRFNRTEGLGFCLDAIVRNDGSGFINSDATALIGTVQGVNPYGSGFSYLQTISQMYFGSDNAQQKLGIGTKIIVFAR